MNPITNFADFVNHKIVKQGAPDISRASFLQKESTRSYSFLKEVISKIGMTDDNTGDLITSTYDILMKLVRAKMLLKGFHSQGHGAHEAEVAYLRELGFKEQDVQFANQLRYFRNGIMYYGKHFDMGYAKQVVDFLEEMYPKLKDKKEL